MFKLLLTVFLGICVGAVVADLLFGPDQPATPSPESQGQHWEPWRSWYLSARRQARRALAAVTAWTLAAAQGIDRGARRLGRSTVATLQLVPDSLRSMQARRQATTERNAAHARHVAHLEAVNPRPRQDPLPPPVAPPLHPEARGAFDASRMSAMSGQGGQGGMDTTPGPNGNAAATGPAVTAPTGPNGSRGGRPGDPSEVRDGPGHAGPAVPESRWPQLGPPMDPPAPVGPPVPASLRGQELIQTSELPVPSALDDLAGSTGSTGSVAPAGPLGRPPWDALVRRPTPAPAPTPGTGGGRRRAGSRSRRRSRRDPLDRVAGEAERPPDPEWDEGVPGPIVVPLRTRARSAAILLAMTTIFGVVTAAAVLIAVVMAVGALDKL